MTSYACVFLFPLFLSLVLKEARPTETDILVLPAKVFRETFGTLQSDKEKTERTKWKRENHEKGTKMRCICPYNKQSECACVKVETELSRYPAKRDRPQRMIPLVDERSQGTWSVSNQMSRERQEVPEIIRSQFPGSIITMFYNLAQNNTAQRSAAIEEARRIQRFKTEG
ncbi:uncharacterized protein LOC133198884 [Saccostrea echinata]|uniref:uncharacterized protein LOC133198884 n=1 Tax=Saccostrea echinata TaxID=191078 RepID=UPI002A8092F4|nr:uncharacterized protein LOC133198884 [Saccostrea echinata]